MSILSSRLTGEFMKAAAAAARTSQPAAFPGPGTSFRDQFEAARAARSERRESAGTSERPDRERDGADAAGATRTREGSEEAEPTRDVDEVVEVDAVAGEVRPRDGETTSVAVAATIDPVFADAPSSLDGGAIIDARSDGMIDVTGVGTIAGPRAPEAATSASRSTTTPGAGDVPAIATVDRDAAVRIDATGTPGRAASSETVATTATGSASVDATSVDRGPRPMAGAGDASAVNRVESPVATATAKAADAAITDPRTRPEITSAESASAGGRIELQDAAAGPERRVEPSAYRAAMADRAAGRDLSPAERQAMSLDERIASARAAAAAGRLGMSGAAAGPGASPVAPASAARSNGRPVAAAATPMADASNASPVRPGAAAATTAGPATASAPTPTIGVDAGVPARPANAGAASGVDAAAMPGRPGGGEDAVAQALRGARMLVGRNGGSLTMRLQPGDLGELRVRMEIRGGRVTADFQTTSEVARERLEQGLEVLRRGLEERGLQVERLTVRAAETETARPNAESGRGGRDADTSSRGGDASGSEGRRDDAADGESRGRREDAPSRRPFAERASSPDALRAFASIFGDRTR